MNALSKIEIEEIEHNFGGKWRAKREEKKQTKQTRKLERINARGTNRANVFGKISDTVKGIFGGGQTMTETDQMQERGLSVDFNDEAELAAQQAKQRTTMIIVAVVIIVIVVLLFVMMRKKAEKK